MAEAVWTWMTSLGAEAAGTAAAADLWATAAGPAAAGTAAAGGAAAGGSLLSKAAGGAATALGTGVVSSLLAPKPPKLSEPTPMPDPLAQQEAKQRAIIEQMSRRGRASTILTDSGTGKLGG